jgi:uncharacterized protein (UPF0332 family)
MFVWGAYLELAERLALEGGEASKRSAMSRAYYSVFHLARQMITREGETVPERGEAHQFVWTALERQGKGRRRLGQEGKRLRELRRKADYDDSLAQIDKHLQDALLTARGAANLIAAEQGTAPR